MLEQRKPKSPWFAFFAIGVLAVLCGLGFNFFMPQGIGLRPSYVESPLWKSVDLKEAMNLWINGAGFVDARDPGDYKLVRVKRAVNLYPAEYEIIYPLLSEQLKGFSSLVVYGRTISRFPAAQVAQKLSEAGIKKVFVLDAVFEDLEEAGFPLRKRARRQTS
ncbi:rhodanese-like domain-containing protein [Dethiosulfatarculus sandiegensis]|uniref:Rhodanese domain-containing protein n=1 Tax=Dethiosulfatarculus sandiegensis TaxID=1429043 RepID=A0A0D2JUQ0_9BACT|nr:rhodanese-like domain-containing protein [Dethiosulfatarculus sandiegensis]KIX13260.1 hypothetical protein X474_14760 [Dethiosulfatarculus sandiegensis]